MIFEKAFSSQMTPASWTACPNCGDKGKDPPHADYQSRSAATASQLNATNNGKSCVSS